MSSKTYHKERYQRLKNEGRCVGCSSPKDNTKWIHCTKCHKDAIKRSLKWRETSPKYNNLKKEQYERNKSQARDYQLRKAGLTGHKEFLQILEEQGRKCAICTREIDEKAHSDHDHNTGRFRGLLCNKCNLMLGLANDSIVILSNAMRYLESTKK